MEKAVDGAEKISDTLKLAEYYRDSIFVAMGKLREDADKLEPLVDKKVWPLPSYSDLLFNV